MGLEDILKTLLWIIFGSLIIYGAYLFVGKIM